MFWEAFIFKTFFARLGLVRNRSLNCLEQKKHLKAAWPPKRTQEDSYI